MRFFYSIFFAFIIFTPDVSAQTAKKYDELQFNQFTCGYFTYVIDILYQSEMQNSPQNSIYIFYYEVNLGKDSRNKQKSSVERSIRSRYGNALNKAKAISLYLKNAYNVEKNRILLFDGGFREELGVEIWVVPVGSEIPKATPDPAKERH